MQRKSDEFVARDCGSRWYIKENGGYRRSMTAAELMAQLEDCMSEDVEVVA